MIVKYGCEKCGEKLRNALKEAGQKDRCPVCNHVFSVPGVVELAKAKEISKRKKAEKAAKVQEKQALKSASSVTIATPPVSQPVGVQKPVVPQLMVAPAERDCPSCGELIKGTAVKCRFCNDFVDGRPQPSPVAAAPQPVNVTVNQQTNVVGYGAPRWNALLAMFLSFIIPGLGQLYKGQVLGGILWFFLTVAGYFLIIPGLILHLCCVIGAGLGDPYH